MPCGTFRSRFWSSENFSAPLFLQHCLHRVLVADIQSAAGLLSHVVSPGSDTSCVTCLLGWEIDDRKERKNSHLTLKEKGATQEQEKAFCGFYHSTILLGAAKNVAKVTHSTLLQWFHVVGSEERFQNILDTIIDKIMLNSRYCHIISNQRAEFKIFNVFDFFCWQTSKKLNQSEWILGAEDH